MVEIGRDGDRARETSPSRRFVERRRGRNSPPVRLTDSFHSESPVGAVAYPRLETSALPGAPGIARTEILVVNLRSGGGAVVAESDR